MRQLTVFKALLARQWFVVARRLPDMFIDGGVAVLLQVIMLRFFLPTMGMSSEWQFPLFIGNMLMLCFTVGYQYGLALTHDIEHTRVVQYHSCLPLSSMAVLVSYLAGAIVSFFVLLVPVGLIGSWFLRHHAVLKGDIGTAVLMITVVILFFTISFTTLGVRYTPEYFLDHVWPRLLGPMFIFGCLLFTWQRIHSFSPKVSYLFLLSPVTYCVEGVRRAVLGDPQFLSVPVCISVIVVLSIGLLYLLYGGLTQRLDLVKERAQ